MVARFFSEGASRLASRGLTRGGTRARSRCSLLHTMAISRALPNSFGQALSKHHDGQDALDMDMARKQHETYVSELGSLIPTLCLPATEDYPDSCFVEDTVIAIGNRALMTYPGHETRRGEVDSIREVLKQQLKMEVHELNPQETKFPAYCDGGDVLYTGRHLLVGVSDRTNEDALERIEQVFPEVPLVPVEPVAQGKYVLHLKSIVTHLDENTLLAPSDPIGYKVLRAMRAQELGYDAIRVPDVLACNAVVVNGTVLLQKTSCKTTQQTLEKACQERNLDLKYVDTSELAKKDAALTCCSVLLGIDENKVPSL